MAQCYPRWKNVLICLCTPCLIMVVLTTYVTLMVCANMTVRTRTSNTLHGPVATHFIASGNYFSGGLAPVMPKTFWDAHPHRGAVCNELQQAIDRYYNPILRPKRKYKRLNLVLKSQLGQRFSKVGDLDTTMSSFDNLPQRMLEFVSNMHKRDYPILIQPNMTCGAGAKEEKDPLLLLLAIKTTETHFENRQAIRQSWGQAGWMAGHKRNSGEGESSGREGGGYVRRVFLIGKENGKELGVDVSRLLFQESMLYGDILQWDFQDSFFNLTLKDVLFWDWFSRRCVQTRFVFKGDDDVFVNTPAMIDYLQEEMQKPTAQRIMRDFMIGDLIGAATPNRANNSKYFVPDSFYKGLYPAYAGGGGVVYSGLLTRRLKHISKKVHLFPIDDVFVGMCMVRLKAYPTHNPAFLTFDFPDKEEEKPCAYHTVLMVHKRRPSQIVQLWAQLQKTQTECWNVTLRDAEKKIQATQVVPTV